MDNYRTKFDRPMTMFPGDAVSCDGTVWFDGVRHPGPQFLSDAVRSRIDGVDDVVWDTEQMVCKLIDVNGATIIELPFRISQGE